MLPSRGRSSGLTTSGLFLLFGLIQLLQGTQALAGFEPNITCPDLFELHGRNCLRIATSDRKWASAVARCKNLGGKLFEPRSKEDIEVVRPRLAKGLYWIGVSDTVTEGSYVYNSTGNPVSYADWIPGQPDNDQLEDCVLLFMLDPAGKPTWRNAKCQVRHRYICQVQPTNDCFTKNTLFLENSVPAPTLAQCQDMCRNIGSCQFVNYNSGTQGCGIRSYRPSNIVNSFGQVTATKTFVIPGTNQAQVGFAEVTEDEYACQVSCQRNPHCNSFTWSAEQSQNPKLCIHNYGETERKFDLTPQVGEDTFVISGPRFCGPNVPAIDNVNRDFH